MQVSQTSLLRLYLCKRCTAPLDSLLGLAAAAVAAHIDDIATEVLWALPADCAQLVLEALISTGELTFKRLARFGGQPVYRLDLADFPAFKPEWLRLLRHAPLCAVSLRNCDLVRSHELCLLGTPALVRFGNTQIMLTQMPMPARPAIPSKDDVPPSLQHVEAFLSRHCSHSAQFCAYVHT